MCIENTKPETLSSYLKGLQQMRGVSNRRLKRDAKCGDTVLSFLGKENWDLCPRWQTVEKVGVFLEADMEYLRQLWQECQCQHPSSRHPNHNRRSDFHKFKQVRADSPTPLGRFLVWRRKQLCVGQEVLALRGGWLTYGMINELENGRASGEQYDTRRKIAKAYEVDLMTIDRLVEATQRESTPERFQDSALSRRLKQERRKAGLLADELAEKAGQDLRIYPPLR